MPAKNSQKFYIRNGYYHVYNRGVEKKDIFRDQQDYNVFLKYLEEYLMPKDTEGLHAQLADPTLSPAEKDKILKQIRMNNFYEEISLLSYVLMPNHFHFFLKQKSKNALNSFMNSLFTRYAMYFNKKYKRTGHLFQGVYKAVLVETEPYFLYLSAYIHRNPLSVGSDLHKQPSSYAQYLGIQQEPWVQPDQILSYFSKTNPAFSYAAFVENTDDFSLIRDEKIDYHDWSATATSTGAAPAKVAKSGFLGGIFKSMRGGGKA